jgi:hypothetical protein
VGWYLQGSSSPTGPWNTILHQTGNADGTTRIVVDPQGASHGFFRLRRTW